MLHIVSIQNNLKTGNPDLLGKHQPVDTNRHTSALANIHWAHAGFLLILPMSAVTSREELVKKYFSRCWLLLIGLMLVTSLADIICPFSWGCWLLLI